MTKLIKMAVESHSDGERMRHHIRIDWDNDRHQSVHLDSLEPAHIQAGLIRASIELNLEQERRKI